MTNNEPSIVWLRVNAIRRGIPTASGWYLAGPRNRPSAGPFASEREAEHAARRHRETARGAR